MSDLTQQGPAKVLSGMESAPERKLLAPVWHTAILIVVLFVYSAVSYFSTRRLAHLGPGVTLTPRQMVPTYVLTFFFEWAMFFYVFWGERKYSQARLRERIGGRWANAVDVLRDIGIALALWITLAVIGNISNFFLKPQGREVVFKLLPTELWQLIPWTLIAVSAGFCEEYAFRGYLMEQFRRLTGAAWLAIVLQGLVFGISHGYQGLALMFGIFLLGTGLGIAAYALKTLRVTMITHAWIDTLAGIGGYLIHHFHVRMP
ncbi:MAG TPA: CPBP family intramembrane glutamic endopeptidase [Candidatus Acidoferrales bacterium]|nr:CPBP family intramembrane glutamic endopeptidase [Candidatus Acidoferrales bacterium]